MNALLGAMVALSACEPMVDTRGHTTDPEDFKQIIMGQSTTEDVAALLGTPTSKSAFGEEIWYYVTLRRETYGMFAPEVADQQVVALRFDQNHVVQAIETHGKDEAKNVTVVEKTTPTEGRHLTMIEQLLGNLGRFTAPGRQIDPRSMGR